MPVSNEASGSDEASPIVMPFDDAAIARAAGLIRSGGIVAVPTETVYGLAADAANPVAVAAIYAAKGRPDFNPLIVHVADLASAKALGRFDALAEKIATAFWPGPLTLVVPLAEGAKVAAALTAGLPTLAIRCPVHPAMRALIAASGCALAAPSANASGGISPTRAVHVVRSLEGRVPLVIDAGQCDAGLESTIVAVRETGWQILREGPVTQEMLRNISSDEIAATGFAIEAPGQLASHYAPSKPLRLNATDAHPDEWLIGFGAVNGADNLSPDASLPEAAANLFEALHRADASEFSCIAVAPIPDTGIGAAINDRLRRAAH